MEEYDPYIFQSLKWISQNDVTELDETFVDRNDEELITNGKNIKLTNENKDLYINKFLEKTLISSNKDLFDLIVDGFSETIGKPLENFNWKTLREIVNGQEKIDIEDWKRNSLYWDDDTYNMFFNILSRWTEENLRKLLKFATGSSSVPIEGFSSLVDLGGLFFIEITNDSERLPEAHTCYNTIILPINNDEDELEKKLLTAIEVNDFALL